MSFIVSISDSSAYIKQYFSSVQTQATFTIARSPLEINQNFLVAVELTSFPTVDEESLCQEFCLHGAKR
jgi:hypothetical protein